MAMVLPKHLTADRMARRGRARRRRGLAPHTAHSTSGQQWGAAWQGTAGQMQGWARRGKANTSPASSWRQFDGEMKHNGNDNRQ